MEKQNGKRRCECPTKGDVSISRQHLYSEEEKSGMNHEPNKCPCTNDLKLYERHGKRIMLCSCCHLSIDKEVGE